MKISETIRPAKLDEGYKLQLERTAKAIKQHMQESVTEAVEPHAKGYQTDVSKAAKIDLKTAIKTLNPREQEVIQMRFQHDMTFDAIGKELGVSKDRVSQILAKIIRKLKHPSRGVVEPTTENFADGRKKVQEALDTPYPYQWQKQDEDHYVAKADTPAGLMLIMFEWMQGDESWNIDFAVNGRMGKSGAGDEFSIFATVIAVIRDWVSKVDLSTVKLISFSADKSGDAGTSRTKLYTRFAKQMASQLGWRLEVNTRDTVDDFFKMHNPDVQVKEAVAGPEECWPNYKKDGTQAGTGKNAGKRVNKCVPEAVEVSLHGDAKKGYVLSKIAVSDDERNAGQGTNAMQDIVDRMDAEGAIIALTPDDAFGGNKNRLIDFYKRFGFVPNKGRNKDFRFRETMIRYPQAATSVELEEDISVTDVAAMAAVAGLAAPVMASLIKGAYKTGKNLLQLKKIASKAGVKLADKLLGESNPFTDARMNAIKAGKTEFVVKGKRYQVTGDTSDELNAVTESLDTQHEQITYSKSSMKAVCGNSSSN
jgi:DNA-binding CsgD family transcriptional regulator/GNAT superfamily N-acetyltransferase